MRTVSFAAGIVRDLVLLVGRVGLGILMVAHALMEYSYAGSVAGMGDLFAQSGVPLPAITGPANMLGELVGGIAMIIGLGVPLVGVLMAANMAGAWIFVHTSGLFAADGNGPGLVIALGLLSLVLAGIGGGRLSLDHLVRRWWRRRSEPAPNNTSLPQWSSDPHGEPIRGQFVHDRRWGAPAGRSGRA